VEYNKICMGFNPRGGPCQLPNYVASSLLNERLSRHHITVVVFVVVLCLLRVCLPKEGGCFVICASICLSARLLEKS